MEFYCTPFVIEILTDGTQISGTRGFTVVDTVVDCVVGYKLII